MNATVPRLEIEKIGVFVAGGPAAGINSVIKGVVQAADNRGIRVVGYLDGARGLYDNDFVHLTRERVENIDFLGGSILGLSRFDLREHPDSVEVISRNIRRCGVYGIISIGGEGTLQLAHLMSEEGLPVVHVPKTIDNDIWGVPQTFGFDTAVQEATRLLSTLKLDAEASDTWFVVEIMGREAGHLAMESGIASGVTLTLIPEAGPIDVASAADLIISRRKLHLDWGVILVAEAAHLGEGKIKTKGRFGGVGDELAERLEESLEGRGLTVRIRTSHLGYFLRCALPTGYDREYAARLGLTAVRFLTNPSQCGSMVLVRDEQADCLPIAESAGKTRFVDTGGNRYRAMLALNQYAAAEQDLRERRELRSQSGEALEWLRQHLSQDTLACIAKRLGLLPEHLLEAVMDLRCEGESEPPNDAKDDE